MSDLAQRFAAYAAHVLGEARELRVDDLARIYGGASRETYRLRLSYVLGGERIERPLILRRDPPGSLIDTDRRTEFAAYRAFLASAVPVPEALWLELDPRWLDHPFFVMEELRGFESSPQALVAPPYAQHAEKIGRRKWEILGEIARTDPAAVGLTESMATVEPAEAWRRELDFWEREIDQDALEPQPIIRAAIRRLRREPPPPPPRLGVVHGDYRSGNFLFDTEGEIRGILDWEMAHLGDPLEDLAWSINRVWNWARDDRAGGLLPKDEAIAIWERAAGRKVDRAALAWWELFSSVKGQGIWVSSQREYLEGANKDPILAMSGWVMSVNQDRAALETMGKLA